MKKLANRISYLSESATLEMTRLGRELSAKGHDVISLSIGEPDFDTPIFIKEAAKRALDKNYTHYTPVAGFAELRKAISHKLKRDNGLEYSANNIVVSTGAKQALTNAVMSIVNPGDEVVIPTPYWVSYSEIVKLAEGKSIFVPTGIESDFKVTPEDLEAAITPKTRLIMLNTPCNPSGSIYCREEMQALVKVIEKYPDIYILSDEIYELIRFEGAHISFASFPSIKDRVIVINGVSKGFAMTGWRIGYLAASQKVATAANKLQGQITSGTNAIAQRATITAMEKAPEHIPELSEMLKAFKSRRDLVLNAIEKIPGITANTPQGAFYVFPVIKEYLGKSYNGKTIENDTDLCMYILENHFVSLVPGSAFGNPDCIRISYATSEERLTEAMNRLAKALSELK